MKQVALLPFFLPAVLVVAMPALAQHAVNPTPPAAPQSTNHASHSVAEQRPGPKPEEEIQRPAVESREAESRAISVDAQTTSPSGAQTHESAFFLAPASPPASATPPSQPATSEAHEFHAPSAQAYPREITIDFPPEPSADSRVYSKRLHKGDAVVEGQGRQLLAVAQRGMAAPHGAAPVHSAPPIATPHVAPASRAPVGGIRIAPLSRPNVSRTLRPFWFLEGPRSASGPPHVFNPRHNPRSPRFFGGFGFFGFPFGSPFFGFGLGFFPSCNPFWAGPWAYGCGGFGYLNDYDYGPGIYSNYEPDYFESEQPPETGLAPEELQNYQYIPAPEESSPEEIEAEKILVVLYLKDGSVYAVTNYWIADGKLHYRTSYGGEDSIDLNDLDLQKTVDVNAKRGVPFTLKPSPDQNSPNQPQPPPDQPQSPTPQP